MSAEHSMTQTVERLLANTNAKLGAILAVLLFPESERQASGRLFATLHLAGMSHAEIGALVGKTPLAVRLAVHRSKARIRRGKEKE